jgi:hypothetical protein
MNAYFVDVMEFNVPILTHLPPSDLKLPQMTSAQAVPDAWNTWVTHPLNIHPHPLSDSRALIA